MKEMLYNYTKWLISELEAKISLGGFVFGFWGGVGWFGFGFFFPIVQWNSQTAYSWKAGATSLI